MSFTAWALDRMQFEFATWEWLLDQDTVTVHMENDPPRVVILHGTKGGVDTRPPSSQNADSASEAKP